MEFKFKAITPVWTWDAWGEMENVRNSTIYGSIRFWFKVFLNCSWNVVDEQFKKDFKVKISDKEIFEGNWVEFLFGKDKWRGLVELKIERVKEKKLTDYSFVFLGKGKVKQFFKKSNVKCKNCSEKEIIVKWPKIFLYLDPSKYCYQVACNKWNREKDKKIKIGDKLPIWYFKEECFEMNFNLKFKNIFENFINNNLVNFEKINIDEEKFRKLINDFAKFLDLFGFVGGKWELGFGKLGLEDKNEVNSQLELNDFFTTENDLFNLNNQNIVVYEKYEKQDIWTNFSYEKLKEYLEWKVDRRNEFREEKKNYSKELKNLKNLKRHYIFGSTQMHNEYPIWEENWTDDCTIKTKNLWKWKRLANGSKLLPVFGKEKFYIVSLVCVNKIKEKTNNS
jgi:CRISPR-associated protein Cmr1